MSYDYDENLATVLASLALLFLWINFVKTIAVKRLRTRGNVGKQRISERNSCWKMGGIEKVKFFIHLLLLTNFH